MNTEDEGERRSNKKGSAKAKSDSNFSNGTSKNSSKGWNDESSTNDIKTKPYEIQESLN